MLSIDRQRLLMMQLKSIGSIKIAESAKKFKVSEETIRRDLNTISEILPIRKIYGGAYIKTGTDDAPIDFRQSFFSKEKENMAYECLKLINGHESIMLDSSTNTSYIAKYLSEIHHSLTVITNSILVADCLSSIDNVTVFCLGGRLRNKAKSFVGSDALDMIKHYVADIAFISPAGLNPDFGLTDFSTDECHIRRAMLQNSLKHCLVADHTKLLTNDLKGTNIVCPLADIDYMISDRELSPALSKACIENNIKVTIAHPAQEPTLDSQSDIP